MIAIKPKKQQQYMTLTATRRLSVEFPYADPFSGAPFAQRKGPAVALIGAAGSISAGISAGGFLGGLMIAGGIASALGALTGNETLSMLGMGFSLASGIGGAFINAETGAFANPFTDGNFMQSYTGKAFQNIKADLGFGDSGGGVNLSFDGNSIVNDAIPSVTEGSFTSDALGLADPSGVNISGGTASGINLAGTSGASGGNGLLSALNNSQGAMGAVSGIANNYMKQQEIDATQELRDAQVKNYNSNASATDAQTDLLQNRYNNMQQQPSVNLGVNENAQVFGNTPGTAQGKIALVINGEVKYVTQAEYDAIRQAQTGQQGGGMLAAGSAGAA